MTRSRKSSSTYLVIIGLLALIVSLPVIARLSYSVAASSGASISLSYSVKTIGSQTIIIVTLTARDSQFPTQVVVSLSSNYNGGSSPFNVQTYTVSTSANGLVSYTFNVPFQGYGSYLFTGSVHNIQGGLLAQASIDPSVEPEWRK